MAVSSGWGSISLVSFYIRSFYVGSILRHLILGNSQKKGDQKATKEQGSYKPTVSGVPLALGLEPECRTLCLRGLWGREY